MPRRVRSAVIYVTLAIAGLFVSVVGAFVHSDSTDLGPIPVPYGLFVAIGAVVSLFWIGRATAPNARSGVIVAGAAWLIGVLPLSTGRPEGDVVLPGGDLRSYAYLFVPLIAAAILATLPAPSRVGGSGPPGCDI